jgi:hypothetical protein
MERVALDSIVASRPPQAFGKAKIVYLEPMQQAATPKLVQMWSVGPHNDKKPDGKQDFSIQCRLDATADETFAVAMKNFDLRVRKLAFENRKSWFGKASDDFTGDSDLRTIHNMSIKKGNEKTDGSRWEDSIKFKITGWGPYCDSVVYKNGGTDGPKDDKDMAIGCNWLPRLVSAQGTGGPSDKETKFYLSQGRDHATGKERAVPKVPCLDPAGNQKKDEHGNLLWEFVGPKHCQPGCKLAVVFQFSQVWLAGGKFGVTLAAKQVFITPAPPKQTEVVEGYEVTEFVDPILASKAVQMATANTDHVAPDGPDGDEDSEEGPAGTATAAQTETTKGPSVPAQAPEAPAAGEKRPAASSSPKPAAKKTKKTITVDEDF